jgi:hypothetical protein
VSPVSSVPHSAGDRDIRARRTAPRERSCVWIERRKGECSGCSPRAAAGGRRERRRRRVGRRTRLGAAREGDRRRGRRCRLAGLRSPPLAVQRPLPRPATEGGRALRRSRGRRRDARVPRCPRPRARHPQRRPLLRRAFLDQRGGRRRIGDSGRVDRGGPGDRRRGSPPRCRLRHARGRRPHDPGWQLPAGRHRRPDAGGRARDPGPELRGDLGPPGGGGGRPRRRPCRGV